MKTIAVLLSFTIFSQAQVALAANSENPGSLIGSWITECQNVPILGLNFKVQETYSPDGVRTSLIQVFSDTQCSPGKVTTQERSEGKYTAQNGTVFFPIAQTQFFVTFNQQDDVFESNSTKLCGYSDWKVGIEHAACADDSSSNVQSADYSVFKNMMTEVLKDDSNPNNILHFVRQ